ncbi:MAG: hypothetical protein U1D55_15275 [Phycisphaerae bacterium]
MLLRKFAVCSVAALALALAAPSIADVPRQFSYQGRLVGQGNATVSLTVNLYDAATAGTLLFSETHNSVTLNDGVFSIIIGGGTAGGVPTTAVGALPVWMGVSVNGAAELTPRTKLQSVPFAFKALGAEQLIIPGSFTPAATVQQDGHVLIENRVEIGDTVGTGGGLVQIRNGSNAQTVKLDGHDASAGGRIDLYNGASSNISTVRIDGNDGDDGRIDLYDANDFQSVRIHSDWQNDAAELSLFAGAQSGSIKETVQLAANKDAGSAGSGELRLRRVDTNQTAITTVQLSASSNNALDQPLDGGLLALNYSDGSPVFTFHAGSTSAISPAFMEIRAPGSSNQRRLYATPNVLYFYDSNNTQTVSIANSGDATFAGTATVGVLTITGGSDLSEQFDIRAASDVSEPEPGMVVSIDPKIPGNLVVCAKAYDRAVAGVISGAGGVKTGMTMSQSGTIADGKHPVALTGRVWVQCDAGGAAIEPGDLLTSSDTPGHAMKAIDASRASGAMLGKAMTPLAKGERGLVLVLVNLQ